MKKMVFLYFLIPFVYGYSQTNSTQAEWVELYFGAVSVPSNITEIRLSFEPQGTVWGTNDFQSFYIDPYLGPISYPLTVFNNDCSEWNGFDIVSSPSPGSKGLYGYGLYKGTVEGITFYIDFRDDRYQQYSSPIIGNSVDIWLKYNYSAKILSISSDSYSWDNIFNNDQITIWDIKGKGAPSTDQFEPYPPQSLTVNEKDESYPILNWQHRLPQDDYWTGYKIYRCVTRYIEDIPTDFIPVATVTKDVTTYADQQIVFGGWNYAYYKVTAVNGNVESAFSNQARASLITLFNKKRSTAEKGSLGNPLNYELCPNYPNPFNPSTRIEYHIESKGKVELSVFDVLGNEVAKLVNEIQDQGIYSVNFNASNLPSGTYIYSLRVNDYIKNSKMVFLK